MFVSWTPEEPDSFIAPASCRNPGVAPADRDPCDKASNGRGQRDQASPGDLAAAAALNGRPARHAHLGAGRDRDQMRRRHQVVRYRRRLASTTTMQRADISYTLALGPTGTAHPGAVIRSDIRLTGADSLLGPLITRPARFRRAIDWGLRDLPT